MSLRYVKACSAVRPSAGYVFLQDPVTLANF